MPDGGKPTLSKIPAFPRLGLESNEDGCDPNDMSFFSCNAHARDQTNVSLHLERERERERERVDAWERVCVCVHTWERVRESKDILDLLKKSLVGDASASDLIYNWTYFDTWRPNLSVAVEKSIACSIQDKKYNTFEAELSSWSRIIQRLTIGFSNDVPGKVSV